MINTFGLFVLCASPIGVSGTAAKADDAKTYPGAMCQTTFNTDQVVRDGAGKMLNPTEREQTWICPIVRDTMAEDSGEFAAVSVLANTRVACTLETRSDRGTEAFSIPPEDPDPGTIIDGVKRLQYALDEDNFAGVKNGYYYFLCRVPATGGIASYQSEEDE